MKRLIILFLLTITSYNCIYSQEIFEKGEIICKNNDTLHVLVQLATTYYDEVPYKLENNSNIVYKKIKEVKTLITPFNRFENITIKKKEKLFRLVEKGKLTLYEYIEINQGSSSSAYGGTMTMYTAPTIIYVIKSTSNTDYILNKPNDKINIIQLFEDCPDLKMQIEDKSFKIKDLKDLVKKYNEIKK